MERFFYLLWNMVRPARDILPFDEIIDFVQVACRVICQLNQEGHQQVLRPCRSLAMTLLAVVLDSPQS